MNNIRTNTNKGISIIPDYIVYIFIVLLLIIDYMPNNGFLISNIQYLYLSVLNFFIGVYFYVNSKKISSNIIPILKKSYVTRIYLVFLLICGLSFITARNTSLVITRITELVIVFLSIHKPYYLIKRQTSSSLQNCYYNFY
jgi:hypothetical protein